MDKNTIPNIALVDDRFEGTITLDAWRGFQSRQGPYTSQDSEQPSNGSFRLDIGGDMVDDDPKITDAHVKAYWFAIENQELIKDTLLDTLMVEYPKWIDSYGYDEEEAEEYMPEVSEKSAFKSLIGLANVHILNVEKDGVAYVGYEFGCTWDDEHGLGFMTHKNRVIDLGGADMSFLTWVAEKDLT